MGLVDTETRRKADTTGTVRDKRRSDTTSERLRLGCAGDVFGKTKYIPFTVYKTPTPQSSCDVRFVDDFVRSLRQIEDNVVSVSVLFSSVHVVPTKC